MSRSLLDLNTPLEGEGGGVDMFTVHRACSRFGA
jgi:hypothetical protein